MTVQVIIQNNAGQEVIRFAGEDSKTFHQMAKTNGIDTPISCGVGVCGFCRSKVIAGMEYIDIGKKSMPLKDLADDEVFLCVGGVDTNAIKDSVPHEIILQVKI